MGETDPWNAESVRCWGPGTPSAAVSLRRTLAEVRREGAFQRGAEGWAGASLPKRGGWW